MKLYDIVSAMGDAVRLIGNDQAEITRLDTDSRKVKDGSLFFCIHGLRVDAHDFAPGAVKAGAAALVVERELDVDCPQLLVADVREALSRIAAIFYGNPARELKLIGKSKCISVGTGDLGSTASAADDDAVSRVLPSFGAHQITIFGFFHCNSRFPCLDFYFSESGFQNQQIKNGLCLFACRIKPSLTAPDADAELFKKLFGILFGKLFENV